MSFLTLHQISMPIWKCQQRVEIVVEQQGPARSTNGVRSWPVTIAATQIFENTRQDLRMPQTELSLEDPLTTTEYLEIETRLENLQSRHSSSAINIWPQEKFDLSSQTLINSLQIADILRHAGRQGVAVHIEVACSQALIQASSEQQPTIHRLYWEVLDNPNTLSRTLGPGKLPISICVVRNIRNTAIFGHVHGGPGNPESRCINVLMVVARKQDPNSPDVWSPTQAPAAIARIGARKQWSCHSPNVKVYVVRPGSLSTLIDVLQSHIKFDIVHFDTHGEIEEQTSELEVPRHRYASMLFNEWDDGGLFELWTDNNAINNLARFIAQKRIPCVVLNVCRSAQASGGAAANLASIFVGAGVPNVLGMSHKVADTMSGIFFGQFYEHLLFHQLDFFESARRARQELRENPIRWNWRATSAYWQPHEDWFTPIVYAAGKPYRVTPSSSVFSNLWKWRFKILLVLFHALLLTNRDRSFQSPKISWKPAVIFLSLIGVPLLSSGCVIAIILLIFRWVILWLSHQKLVASLRQPVVEIRALLLEVESGLQAAAVFLHDPPDHNTLLTFLRRIRSLWHASHFVDCTVHLDASYFLKDTSSWSSLVWYGWQYLKIRSISHWKTQTSLLGCCTPRMLIVVENLHLLYQHDILPDQRLQLRGLPKFIEWVETMRKEPTPYLIVTQDRTDTDTMDDDAVRMDFQTNMESAIRYFTLARYREPPVAHNPEPHEVYARSAMPGPPTAIPFVSSPSSD